MKTKITKIISYLLIISMIMTGLAYAAEGLNSLNEISTYEQNFIAAMSKSYLMLIPVMQGKFSRYKNHWCQDVIEKFVSKKWVAGYDDGLFRPDSLVTRAEFTTMVVNIFKRC